MKIVVNGEGRDVPEGTTVSELLEQAGLETDGGGVAVAVDAEVVPRSDWGWKSLSDGQAVELLRAIQGG